MDSQRGMHRMRISASAVGLSVVLVCAGAASASADQPLQVDIVPDETSISYGGYWQLEARLSGQPAGGQYPVPGEVRIASIDGIYSTTNFYGGAQEATAYVGPSMDHAPLDVGAYEVSVSARSESYGVVYSGASAPATLTITPAPLTTDVRMIADPNSPGNAVVSVSLVGEFINNLAPAEIAAENPSIAVLPAGTWHVVVKDSSGTPVLDKSIDQSAGGRPATTMYWSGTPDGQYNAEGSFTPVAESASNLAIAPATPFPYTSPAEQRPQPVPDVPGPEPEPVPTSSTPTVPVWSIAGAGLVALGLAVAILVMLIRLGGARRATTAGRDTNATSA
jgi:hypothetical protein